MKNDEIEVMAFESEVEILGVENAETVMLDNEEAFIVEVDEFPVYEGVEIMGDVIQQENDLDSF